MDWGLLLHCAALTFTLARALRSDKCGDTIKILSPGYLTSPGYPQSYHPSQKCEWLIQAPEPYQRIMINFNPHFDLEDRDCNHSPETPTEGKIYRRKIESKGNGSINLY